MKVILLKDIKGVGQRFEEKNVSDGYAMNFLLPKNLALAADKAGLAKTKQLQEASAAKKAEETARLEEKEKARLEKREEKEKFKQAQHSLPSS